MAHLEFHNHYVDLSTVFYHSHVDLLRNICIELDAVHRVKELEEKFLDKLKIKAKKDPMKPKKGKTSYMFFCEQLRNDPSIGKSLDPSMDMNIKFLKISEQSKKFGALWQGLKDEDKQKYIDKRLVRDFYCNHGEDYINGIVSFPDILNNGEVL